MIADRLANCAGQKGAPFFVNRAVEGLIAVTLTMRAILLLSAMTGGALFAREQRLREGFGHATMVR